MSRPSHIYILHEREFMATGEMLYKVGRIGDIMRLHRFRHFPKGSQIKFVIDVPADTIDEMEEKILLIFRYKYEQRPDIGEEYFVGDSDCMIRTIIGILHNL